MRRPACRPPPMTWPWLTECTAYPAGGITIPLTGAVRTVVRATEARLSFQGVIGGRDLIGVDTIGTIITTTITGARSISCGAMCTSTGTIFIGIAADPDAVDQSVTVRRLSTAGLPSGRPAILLHCASIMTVLFG